MKKFLRTAVCCLAAILLCNGIIIGCSEYKKSDLPSESTLKAERRTQTDTPSFRKTTEKK